MSSFDDEDWEPGEELEVGPGPQAQDDSGQGAAEPAKKEAKPVYGSLKEWLGEHFVKAYQRRLGGSLTWCPKWYLHAEAVSRLNSLWQEWEKAVAEHTMSNWWLLHCDPHMNVLMSRDNGPFMACKPDEHRAQGAEPLSFDTGEDELWQGTAFSDPDPSPPAADHDRAAAATT